MSKQGGMTPSRSVEEWARKIIATDISKIADVLRLFAVEQVADKEADINALKAMLVEQDAQIAALAAELKNLYSQEPRPKCGGPGDER